MSMIENNDEYGPGFRVLVCGGRDYTDMKNVYKILNRVNDEKSIKLLIQGGARGADYLAAKWARGMKINTLTFNADWKRFGAAAGPIRNQRMLTVGRPDLIVAFPGGRGTADMVNRAKKAGVTLMMVEA